MKRKQGRIKIEPKRRPVMISAVHHTALTRLAAIGRRDIGAEAERLIDEELKRQRMSGDLRDLDATGTEHDDAEHSQNQ